MTNSDIALVRDFSDYINEAGEASCSFRGRNNGCPHAEATMRIAAEFKWDEDQWKAQFRDELTKILLTG